LERKRQEDAEAMKKLDERILEMTEDLERQAE
jgi:hypothetical protein